MLSFVVTMAPSYSAPAVVGRAARAAVSMNIADLPGAGEETLMAKLAAFEAAN